MKARTATAGTSVTALVLAVALMSGCASGGGHGGGGSQIGNVDTTEELVLCMLLPFLCILDGATANRAPSRDAPPVAFTTWSKVPSGAMTEVKGVSTKSNNDPTAATGNPFAETTERVSYSSSSAGAKTLASVGQPGFEVRSGGVLANPYVLGWEYQSFGIWSESGVNRASSFGAPTAASAVPTSGSATFSGKLIGLYVSPAGQEATAVANLSVNANFNSRSLSFSSTGTTTTPDARTPTAAPQLNLSGSLTYSPGSSSFSGALTNSGGTMSGSSTGKFYGPAAQELGGAFSLKSPTTAEAFRGAYGAKR